jgi:hypothetical protein
MLETLHATSAIAYWSKSEATSEAKGTWLRKKVVASWVVRVVEVAKSVCPWPLSQWIWLRRLRGGRALKVRPGGLKVRSIGEI